MSRKTHLIESVNQYLHLYNRGVNHEQIFFSDADYRLFMSLMAEALEPSALNIHAFTLMPNHYHIIVSQRVPRTVSSFCKKLCERYATHLNMTKARTGHLFQRRFKLKLIPRVNDLLYLSRYVHLNPVVARLVARPEDWQYGSCHSYCDGRATGFTSTSEILGLAGGSKGYRSYLMGKPVTPHGSIEKCLIDSALP